MKHVLAFITVSILLVACGSTSNLISIEVLEPALITPPSDVKNVLIVDNSPSQEKESIMINGEENTESHFISTDSARNITLYALSQFMDDEKYFNNIDLYPRNTNGGYDKEIKPLSLSKIQSISREKDADMLIVLDLFTISAESEYINTDYFEGFTLLTAKLGSIVRAYDNTGKEIVKPFVHLDSLYQESSSKWTNRNNIIQEMNGLVQETAIHSADKIANVFVPLWKKYDRRIYTSGSKDMKSAESLVAANKWGEAADIWAMLYATEKNKSKAAQLASNIAVANECIDDVKSALYWINEAYDNLPTTNRQTELGKQIVLYKAELIKRNHNIPKLEEQLGNEYIE